MTAKKSVTPLKGLVRKPASPVTIAMMNEASKGPMVNKDNPKVVTKPSYKLSELLAEMDPNEPVPEDIKAWMDMKPVGKEII
jgi:hypothetical protein